MTQPKPTVVLFDIDGTIISSGGAGRRALTRAFRAQWNITDACDFSFSGMTDPAIFRRGLSEAGQPCDDSQIEQAYQNYLNLLEVEVARSTTYRVHPGLVDAVDRLLAVEHVAVGLGTGNMERGARIKLERPGLNDRFVFGGFGSDADDRAQLLEVGVRRGAARLNHDRADCDVIIVGDTPRDVAAAHAVGGRCVGVCTGGGTAAELEACGSDWVVKHLGVPSAIAALGLN